MTDETNSAPRFEPIMKGDNDYSVFDNLKHSFVLDEKGKRRSWKTGNEVVVITGNLSLSGLVADLVLA